MNYNLAELDVVEVRKGAGEGPVNQHFWQMSDEPKPASFNLEGVGLRRAGAISTILAIPLTILPLRACTPRGIPRRKHEFCSFLFLPPQANYFIFLYASIFLC